jgi:hypothetical protein
MRRLFHPLFSADAGLRGAAGVYAMAVPHSFLSWFAAAPLPRLAVDLARCFGALLFALGYIEWRALRRFRRMAVIIVLQGMMLADLTFLTNFLAIPLQEARSPAPAFFTVIVTITIIVVRGYFLAIPRAIPERPPPPHVSVPPR